MKKTKVQSEKIEKPVDKTSFMYVFKEQLRKDRFARFALVFLAVFLIFVYGSAFFINAKTLNQVDLSAIFKGPSLKHLLGTEGNGKDVFAYMIVGARNSFTIGLTITAISGFVGITIGAIAGYFGGAIDNIVMRVIDFVSIIPFMMLIIVFVSIVPKYSIWSFIGIMSAFGWMAKARLVRAKALSEREEEYIAASKVLGTPNWKIILFELLPNISSIIIVNMILTLAGNIGIETSLSYLGFGLPAKSPSLGTLIAMAGNPLVMQKYIWVWLPSTILIIVLMLCINSVGQATKRSLDAQQRM